MSITAGEIAQARKLAAASRRRLVDVLEETLQGDADAFTAQLAKTLRLRRFRPKGRDQERSR